MLLRNAWYIGAWADELDDKPLARRICGDPVVLFRDGSGRAAALADRCCHRAAPLHLGSLVEAGIQCGYHSLVFDTTGRCVTIPGQKLIPQNAQMRGRHEPYHAARLCVSSQYPPSNPAIYRSGLSWLPWVRPLRHVVNEPSVARHLDGHDVHLALSGEPVRKDAIGTNGLPHPNCKIKDRGPARFIVLSHANHRSLSRAHCPRNLSKIGRINLRHLCLTSEVL